MGLLDHLEREYVYLKFYCIYLNQLRFFSLSLFYFECFRIFQGLTGPQGANGFPGPKGPPVSYSL